MIDPLVENVLSNHGYGALGDKNSPEYKAAEESLRGMFETAEHWPPIHLIHFEDFTPAPSEYPKTRKQRKSEKKQLKVALRQKKKDADLCERASAFLEDLIGPGFRANTPLPESLMFHIREVDRYFKMTQRSKSETTGLLAQKMAEWHMDHMKKAAGKARKGQAHDTAQSDTEEHDEEPTIKGEES
jgi:hypothetical protein